MRVNVFCLIAAAACALACADRRESVAREDLRERINSESKGALTLAGLTKTNGFEHEREGMKLSTVEWESRIEVRADSWKAGWRDYNVLPTEPNALAAAVEGLTVRRLLKGGTVILHGKSDMQKADRGWRVLESAVTASQINPPPEVAAVVGIWHVLDNGTFFRIEYDESRGLLFSSADVDPEGRLSWVNTRPARIDSGALILRYAEGSGTITRVSQSELLSTEEDAFGQTRHKAVRVEGGPERVVALSRVRQGTISHEPLAARVPNTGAQIGQWTLPDQVAFVWQRSIEPREVAGLSKSELKRLRNFIYARHGRAFASQDLRQFFEQQRWYRVNAGYADSLLSPIERANVGTIAKLENARP